jgi:hypothetical protein
VDAWQELEARYSPDLPGLARREAERQTRAELQARYLAWTAWVAPRVIEDLRLTLEARRAELPWLAKVPIEVSVPSLANAAAGPLSSLTARLWNTTVHVYVQCSLDSPPSVHLLRQWGGHRNPRMACVSGAWIGRPPTGEYTLHRFEPACGDTSLDELAATALALLLGRAGHG